MNSDLLRRAFYDVCRGFSTMEIGGKIVYIKHLAESDRIDLDRMERTFFREAQRRKLPSEAQRIEQLKKEKRWSDEKDKEISDIRLGIDSTIANRKNVQLPSHVLIIDKQIKDDEERYQKKLRERSELIGLTCEQYSQRKINEYYIFSSLFKSKELTLPYFSHDEFDELSERELSQIISEYNRVMDPCSDINLKRLVIQDFFLSYYYVSGDSAYNLYGKPIWQLTLLQVKMANFAKYFKSIFENYDIKSAPKNILDDPDKLVDWVMATDRAKKEIEKQKDSDMGGMAGKMTKEDKKALGMAENSGPDPLTQALQKKGGGSLNKEELMKLFGKG